MSDKSNESVPIIADFGYARRIADGQLCNKLCGTKGYMAPEMLNRKKYALTVDIWSFGILLYVLVSGSRFPFPHPKKRLSRDNSHEFGHLL